ncbi:hypothetical protein QBC33DRAFT_13109 [Phialemonium atrogriseum]|uniref:Uncharacterized protein n=1 Tax=Phialemonium atrogriseum TaxID=1093897 RepID=A0AAJ0FLR9_9PEZI|nr:uncharacterized protein QBC33DRAFT_13109 [Phialemonium atrogriseum]KAK1772512.1 hypothetical protein QBC33DRAFT_13109 [Phialemonium atrogriseum]
MSLSLSCLSYLLSSFSPLIPRAAFVWIWQPIPHIVPRNWEGRKGKGIGVFPYSSFSYYLFWVYFLVLAGRGWMISPKLLKKTITIYKRGSHSLLLFFLIFWGGWLLMVTEMAVTFNAYLASCLFISRFSFVCDSRGRGGRT